MVPRKACPQQTMITWGVGRWISFRELRHGVAVWLPSGANAHAHLSASQGLAQAWVSWYLVSISETSEIQ